MNSDENCRQLQTRMPQRIRRGPSSACRHKLGKVYEPLKCHAMQIVTSTTPRRDHAIPNRQKLLDPMAHTCWSSSTVVRYSDEGNRARQITDRTHSAANKSNRLSSNFAMVANVLGAVGKRATGRCCKQVRTNSVLVASETYSKTYSRT